MLIENRGETGSAGQAQVMSCSYVSAALQLFPSKAVGGAAEAFHSLLRILGPEAAIESVIRAVGLQQDT